MTMVLERVLTRGIAQLSYLIGDDSSGTAAVIDPRPDVRVYLDMAREYGVSITHIFETHIHADFMSGSRELAARVGTAKIHVSGEGDPDYGFEHAPICDGDRFEFGSVVLTAKHTPGHTPEHMAYRVAEKEHADAPWGVLTGDSLFVGSAGRPDLLGEEATEKLTEQLFHTLRDFYLGLDDHVIMYPCHGAGSACGAAIGDRPSSTIGYERRFNAFLQIDDFEQFKKYVHDTAPPEPAHYRRLKKLNAAGPELLGHAPVIPALPPQQFREAVERGDATLVDTRHMLAFGGGHIPGAVNIGGDPDLSVWAGQMVDPARPILLVVENESDVERILWLFVNVGLTRFAGYLAGGMKAWDNAGLPLAHLPQMNVHELRQHAADLQILDVRTPSEWQSGHIPGAHHAYVARLRDAQDGASRLDPQKPVAVYCGSGYRADIAASILQTRGFQDVRNVPGSWQAWQKADYPVEK